MENILLIGGNGFIGKNLIDYCINNGFGQSVRLIVVTRESNDYVKYFEDEIEYRSGDFSDLVFLDSLFLEFEFEAVFHFANTIVPSSVNDRNIQDLYENVIPTIQLMDTMKKYNCNFLLYLSSGGAVYGNFADTLNEEHWCHPISSYGIAKLTIENYIQLYHRLFGLDFLILRISNPYGKFHLSSRQGIINIAIRNALNRKPVVVWGDGMQTKDYIFAEDISRIIWRLFFLNVKNEILNVGSGQSVCLNDILSKISSFIPNIEVQYEGSKATDVNFFELNISKLKSFIDFEPIILDTGILETIEWEKRQIQ